MRFGSSAKLLAKCELNYRFSDSTAAGRISKEGQQALSLRQMGLVY